MVRVQHVRGVLIASNFSLYLDGRKCVSVISPGRRVQFQRWALPNYVGEARRNGYGTHQGVKVTLFCARLVPGRTPVACGPA
jgi:hypothetical protein